MPGPPCTMSSRSIGARMTSSCSAGDGGDDVAHRARPLAVEFGQQRVGDATADRRPVGIGEVLLDDVDEIGTLDQEPTAAVEAERVVDGGAVEGIDTGARQSTTSGSPTVILDVPAADVPAVGAVVDAAEREGRPGRRGTPAGAGGGSGDLRIRFRPAESAAAQRRRARSVVRAAMAGGSKCLLSASLGMRRCSCSAAPGPAGVIQRRRHRGTRPWRRTDRSPMVRASRVSRVRSIRSPWPTWRSPMRPRGVRTRRSSIW